MFRNLFSNEKLNIVVVSSYPSQIGFLIEHKFYLEKNISINKNYSSKKYLIVLYPTRTDKFVNNKANLIKCLNSLKENDAFQIELIIIKNIYIRFLAYLKTLFIRIYKRNNVCFI